MLKLGTVIHYGVTNMEFCGHFGAQNGGPHNVRFPPVSQLIYSTK